MQDVVNVDGQQLQKALAACRGHRVARMVSVRPGIGAWGQAPIGQQIQNTLTVVEIFHDDDFETHAHSHTYTSRTTFQSRNEQRSKTSILVCDFVRVITNTSVTVTVLV